MVGEGGGAVSGATPLELDFLVTADLEVFDLDFVTAFFEGDGGLVWFAELIDAVAGDDFAAIEGQGASVIGVEGEGVGSFDGGVEVAFPNHAEIVLAVVSEGGLIEGNDAVFFFFAIDRLGSAEVGEGLDAVAEIGLRDEVLDFTELFEGVFFEELIGLPKGFAWTASSGSDFGHLFRGHGLFLVSPSSANVGGNVGDLLVI